VVADNGSTDGSQRLAREAGARVAEVPECGYGNALMGGIVAARGKYIIMGDSDDSYDFTGLMPFLERLRGGADLVMGNRFRGGIAPGAMRPLHRYLGNPVLSFIGRLFFHSKIGDFHCGLRGFQRDSVLALGLQASGMEFASEMVVKATLVGQRVEEVPTTLSPDGRSRSPHLRSWRDGWRHLRFLLLFSPRWLFLIPGLLLLTLGLALGAAVEPAPLVVGRVTFDVDTLAVAMAMIVIGFQSVLFALFTKIYASAEGFLPDDERIQRMLGRWGLERGLMVGIVLGAVGLICLVSSTIYWHGFGFSHFHYRTSLRIILPSVTALILSCQTIFGSFFLSILGIRRTHQWVVPASPTVEMIDARSPADPSPVALRRDRGAHPIGCSFGTRPGSISSRGRFPSRCLRRWSALPQPTESAFRRGTDGRVKAATRARRDRPVRLELLAVEAKPGTGP
jgi:Glycosyl transferase family 2